jgi:steroid delta-isomerase-like uncharacterized protein
MASADSVKVVQVEVGRRWAEAWSAHDPDAVAGLFDDDGEYDDVAFGIMSPGRRGARDWAKGFLASFPDLHVAVIGAYVSSGVEVVEWRMSGTHMGEFDGIPPTGRRFDVRGVTLLHLRDGRVVRCSDYWDLATVRRQLEADNIDGTGAGRGSAQ